MALNEHSSFAPEISVYSPRLGGPVIHGQTMATIIPVSSAKDTFCRASRDQSSKLYVKECEVALKNK